MDISYEQRLSEPDSLEFRRKIIDLVHWSTMYKLTTNEISPGTSDLREISRRTAINRRHPYRIRPDKPNTTVQKFVPCKKRSSTKWIAQRLCIDRNSHAVSSPGLRCFLPFNCCVEIWWILTSAQCSCVFRTLPAVYCGR